MIYRDASEFRAQLYFNHASSFKISLLSNISDLPPLKARVFRMTPSNASDTSSEQTEREVQAASAEIVTINAKKNIKRVLLPNRLSFLFPGSPTKDNGEKKTARFVPPRWMPRSGRRAGTSPQVPLSLEPCQTLRVHTESPGERLHGAGLVLALAPALHQPRTPALSFSPLFAHPGGEGQGCFSEQVVSLALEAEVFFLPCVCTAASRQGLCFSRATGIET